MGRCFFWFLGTAPHRPAHFSPSRQRCAAQDTSWPAPGAGPYAAPLWPFRRRAASAASRARPSGLGGLRAQISDELRERPVVGGAEAGGRVPAGDGIEAVVGGAALVVRAEADVLVAVGARVEVRVGRALTLTLALALALALPLALALAQTWKPDGLR